MASSGSRGLRTEAAVWVRGVFTNDGVRAHKNRGSCERRTSPGRLLGVPKTTLSSPEELRPRPGRRCHVARIGDARERWLAKPDQCSSLPQGLRFIPEQSLGVALQSPGMMLE